MTGERQLIKKIKEWIDGDKIGDDCAVLPPLGEQSLISADMLVEGRHFSLDYKDYESLGWKSCAVNLSDIAAMAGRPRFLTISISLPEYIGEDNLQSFYQGFNRCARAYGAEVVGGDLTGGERLVIAVTVVGAADESGPLLRSGARVGDRVVVSGEFGASALGLKILQSLCTDGRPAFSPERKALIKAHLRPLPRFEEAFALARAACGRAALMDASDGLADALFQICEASGVSMQVNQDLIPTSAALRTVAADCDLDPLQLALYGGEDYELVGCVDSDLSIDFLEGRPPFITIGRVVAQDEPGTPKVSLFVNAGEGEKVISCVDLNNCYQHFC